MKIYTKKGDDGTTALMNGKRIPKHSLQIAACGDLDELNSFVGLAKSRIQNENCETQLYAVQSDLFLIGSILADSHQNKKLFFSLDKVHQLEVWIDEMEEELEQLSNFILPGGSEKVAFIHVCRAICRRAERTLSALSEKEKIDTVIVQYINRLSDFFFVCARFIAFMNNEKEIIWEAR